MKNSDKQNFLLDGFPRNKDNVDGWHTTMDDRINIQCLPLILLSARVRCGTTVRVVGKPTNVNFLEAGKLSK